MTFIYKLPSQVSLPYYRLVYKLNYNVWFADTSIYVPKKDNIYHNLSQNEFFGINTYRGIKRVLKKVYKRH